MEDDEMEQGEARNAIDLVADCMVDFRHEVEAWNEAGTAIAEKTRFIMRAVFMVLVACSIYMVFMIVQMSTTMGVMTNHLESMYGRFGTMSNDMSEITEMVGSMGRNISGMPEIARSVDVLNANVNDMSGSVHGMNQSVTAIDNDMVRINRNMQEMTGRLSNMSRSVNLMSYDVNEMAQPMSGGPMSWFWPY